VLFESSRNEDRPPFRSIASYPAAHAVALVQQNDDEDLKAIYAYLRTIPPIQNNVPDYEEPPGK
jgi:hypothetical protein